MSEWFQQQFGDRGQFAVCISLGVDPHPCGQRARDLTWGTLEIWTRDRCLTASVSDSGVSQGIRWSLLPVLEWLIHVGVRLVNEDPYPRFSKGRDVADGAAWIDATLSPPVLTEDAERRWFLRRSEWRHHHALRRAAEDVALPNIVFRRLADDIEISWDNEAWSAPRPNVTFVQGRGRALVHAQQVGAVLRKAVAEVLSALSMRTGEPRLTELARQAEALQANAEDWRWLIHRPTAQLIREHLPDLRQSLDESTSRRAAGLYVPHTLETLVLRHVRLERTEDVRAMLAAAGQLSNTPLAPALQALVRPAPASSGRPWEEGNEYAEIVREGLGWGNDPVPDLSNWMPSKGVCIPTGDLSLPPAVAVLARRTDDLRALAHVNPRGTSRMKRETGLATALGHLLLDDVQVAVDGDWEHWPTSARARAFGVALTLPEEGVRDVLNGASAIGVPDVRAVMGRFRTGAWATTYRLKNLGFITPEEQMELAQVA